MFIEVDVQEGPNSPLSLTRIFETQDTTRIVSWAKVGCPDGQDRICHVTGWSSQGPCTPYAVLVDDSGEGLATLLYGGDQGIRLKPEEYEEPWDLNSPHQWGEACLLLDMDVSLG